MDTEAASSYSNLTIDVLNSPANMNMIHLNIDMHFNGVQRPAWCHHG